MFVLVLCSNDHFKYMYLNVHIEAGVFKCGVQMSNRSVCVCVLFNCL
jgi:hypothetical protein